MLSRWRAATTLLALSPLLQAQDAADEIEKLRAMLAAPGAEGRENRERAIERLLALPRTDAHAVLLERLRSGDDTDGACIAIATSLQRHVLLPPASWFGAVGGRVRDRLVVDYVRALAACWRPTVGAELRAAARQCLQRMPTQELEPAARTLFTELVQAEQVDLLRALADMQSTAFAAAVAERLEADDAVVRDAAVEALNLLLWPEAPIRSKAQFTAWSAVNGQLRYVDLVERAARRGREPLQRLEQELGRLRVDAAREIVRAHVARAPGIDWATVQARVMVDDDQVLDACLELLQQALPAVPDDVAPARATFARALASRAREPGNQPALRRVRLLEVAAYLGRGDDSELARELVGALQSQLGSDDAEVRAAALRGLRRFPNAETRASLVALAHRLCDGLPATRDQVVAILAVLGSRATPRWTAPSSGDADKAEWLRLLERVCRSDEPLDVREQAAAVAQTLDARDQRVGEAFELLAGLVRDTTQATRMRAACAIQLQGWRSDVAFAEAWLRLHHELVRDAAPELRQQAAEALAVLSESVDPRRAEWLGATILLLRERLIAESEPQVFRAVVDCLQSCGREAAMTERVLGAMQGALAGLTPPIPLEHQFRLDPLLQALATIGADPRAERAQWLAVCQSLLEHGRRQSLRLILSNHAAADLGKDVAAEDAGLAARARAAMVLLIQTGAMKPVREAWSSSEDLLREAREIRAAFNALDDKDRPDRPEHRVLRLEVELVAGKPQEVVTRATGWLADTKSPLREDDRNRVRVLLAEALLQLGRADAARKALEERTGDVADDAAQRSLEHRLAQALVATDLAGATELLGRVWRRTPTEDKDFRARVLEWAQWRVRLDAGARDEVLRELERFAPLFTAADCPADLAQGFAALRGR